MARQHIVNKARKDQGACEKCGKAIAVGAAYRWVQPKTSAYGGRKRKRCTSCPPWTAGELTTSRLGAIWTAQAAIDFDQYDTADDVTAAIEELTGVIREVADGDREAAQNIEDGFGHATTQSDELAARGEALEAWADDIDGIAVPDTDDYQADCCECHGDGDCPECDGDGTVRDEVDESVTCEGCDGSGDCLNCGGEGHDGIDFDAWRDAVRDELSIVNECPV